MKITDIIPEMLQKELLRLYRLDPNWVRWESTTEQTKNDPTKGLAPESLKRYEEGDATYKASCSYPSWVRQIWQSGADAFAMWANSVWLGQGPKVFHPTVAQCEALEQVEVNVTLTEYSQPYPALMVALPEGRYGPFSSILCHKSDKILTCILQDPTHLNDITTTVAVDGRPIEVSLQRFDSNLADLAKISGKALRVAVNSCLALVSFGCHASLLFPKEAARDRSLAAEQTERGRKARERLKLAVKEVRFDREVILRRTEEHQREPGAPTGREMPFHWRKGHWHTVLCGKGKTERKRLLFPPTMVRADKLLVDASETSTTYKTKE